MSFLWQKTADGKCGPLRQQHKKTSYVLMKMVQRTKCVACPWHHCPEGETSHRENQQPRKSTCITGQLERGLATATPACGQGKGTHQDRGPAARLSTHGGPSQTVLKNTPFKIIRDIGIYCL